MTTLLSVLMVAESMCQAYFLHELIPFVLALHKTQLEKSVHEGKKLFLSIVIFYVSFQLGILCKATIRTVITIHF